MTAIPLTGKWIGKIKISFLQTAEHIIPEILLFPKKYRYQLKACISKTLYLLYAYTGTRISGENEKIYIISYIFIQLKYYARPALLDMSRNCIIIQARAEPKKSALPRVNNDISYIILLNFLRDLKQSLKAYTLIILE